MFGLAILFASGKPDWNYPWSAFSPSALTHTSIPTFCITILKLLVFNSFQFRYLLPQNAFRKRKNNGMYVRLLLLEKVTQWLQQCEWMLMLEREKNANKCSCGFFSPEYRKNKPFGSSGGWWISKPLATTVPLSLFLPIWIDPSKFVCTSHVRRLNTYTRSPSVNGDEKKPNKKQKKSRSVHE